MRLLLLAGLCLSVAHASADAQSAGTASTAPAPSTRIVLVTGSTDGLGRELARRLAGEGAHVIVHGRNAARGKAVGRVGTTGPTSLGESG